MISLYLPKKFENILKRKQNFLSETLRVMYEFSEWVKDNKLEFFPAFTDHGIEHIQAVLNTAEKTISDTSWEFLTPEDIFVLISSILLHDSAMHIDKHGLWSLLTDDQFNSDVLGKYSSIAWSERWEEFKKRVVHFEEDDWYKFFGEYKTVSIPEINENNLSDDQKIIIGDFIREYHADLAQLIACCGVPIKDGAYKIFKDTFLIYNKLAGFIARSHNYNLRDMVDEINKLADKASRVYLDTHPAFLMGVLRIADYLQFEQSRTPRVLFSIKGRGMCSPISLSEWEKHLSIIRTHREHDDIELLYVYALPENAKTLENIKKLLKVFQEELDSFWAVHGEIYSQSNDLSKLGLKLRRVKSNIDDSFDYIQKNNKTFFPEILSIKSDNHKIFPMLIGPLYGHIPQIGIRELLQNSIDACNERYSVDIHHSVLKEDIPYNVVITLNMDENVFIIEDNGIGMDVAVIKDFFLRIGASYRYSEVWKATHSDGANVYVPRTGKFGIGMLAGFLIGDEISVASRKVGTSVNQGVKFVYKLNSQDIQIDYIDKLEVGTKITIKSNENKMKNIMDSLAGEKNSDYFHIYHNNTWEPYWYYLDTPSVCFDIIEHGKKRSAINPDIIKKQKVFSDWYCITTTSLDGFYWRINYRTPYLYCNGILIRHFYTPKIEIDFGLTKISISHLEIFIFDSFGLFPLNLTRSRLITNEFFEVEKLKDNVVTYYFQQIKEHFDEFSWSQDSIVRCLKKIPEYFTYDNPTLPMVFIKDSILPIGDARLKDNYVLFDFLLDGQKRGIIYNDKAFSLLENYGYGCSFHSFKEAYITRRAIQRFVLNMQANTDDNSYGRQYELKDLKNTKLNLDGWVFVKKDDFNKLSHNEILYYKDFCTVQELNINWFVVSSKENSKKIPEVGRKIIECKGLKSFIFAIIKFNQNAPTEFSELWKEHIE